MSISRADNRISGALNLGSLPGQRSRSGFVGLADKLDFFKVAIAQGSDLSLSLKRLKASANLKLELRNSQGRLITRSRPSGKNLERLSAKNLKPGVYFIGVRRIKGDSRYRLTASGTLSEPGSTAATALDLGVLGSELTISNQVSATDPKDLYKLTINDVDTLTAELPLLSAEVDATLYYDQNRNGLIDANENLGSLRAFPADGSSSGSGFSSQNPDAGTYFLEIAYVSGSAASYRLRLGTT